MSVSGFKKKFFHNEKKIFLNILESLVTNRLQL